MTGYGQGRIVTNKDSLRKPNDWKSAIDLKSEFIGGSAAINRRLAALRAALLGDIVEATGWSCEDAAAAVDRYLVGFKKPPHGPQAIAASPEAIRLLDLPTYETAPAPKPTGWLSAKELNRCFRGGATAINLYLKRLWEVLIEDVRKAGQGEAEWLVTTYLVGIKKPPRGPFALAVSPDGMRIVQQDAALERRSRQ